MILLSGFLFYSGCCLAALAMVATYIIGLYGAAATAVYAGAGMVRVGGGQVVRMCAPRVRVLTQIHRRLHVHTCSDLECSSMAVTVS